MVFLVSWIFESLKTKRLQRPKRLKVFESFKPKTNLKKNKSLVLFKWCKKHVQNKTVFLNILVKWNYLIP